MIPDVDELPELLLTGTPEELLLAVVQLGLVVACGALVLLLGAAFVAEVTRRCPGRVVTWMRRWTPASVQHAVGSLARLGLATGTVLGVVTPLSRQAPPAAAATLPEPADDPGASGQAQTAVMAKLDRGTDEPPAHATMQQLEEDRTPVAEPATSAPVDPGQQQAPQDPGASPTAADQPTWVVQRGESFWSIAEELLTERAGGRRPAEAEILRYWRRLIAANRDRLVAPANPDLLQVGQVLRVPPAGG